MAPRGTFQTRDGKWIAISAGAPAVYSGLCRALEAPELESDPRFIDNQSRRQHEDALEEALREAFARFDQADLLERLVRCGAPGAPINSVAELVADPHVQARNSVVSVWDEELDCEVRMQNVIGRLSLTPGAVRHPAPALGAHNQEVLMDELGFDEHELRAAGIDVPGDAGKRREAGRT